MHEDLVLFFSLLLLIFGGGGVDLGDPRTKWKSLSPQQIDKQFMKELDWPGLAMGLLSGENHFHT